MPSKTTSAAWAERHDSSMDGHVLPAPGEQIDQVGPVRLVLDAGLQGVRPGHDEQVGRVAPELRQREVSGGDAGRRLLTPRHPLQGVAAHLDHV